MKGKSEKQKKALKEETHSKKRITDEILIQVGKSVVLVFVIVAVVVIFMIRSSIVSFRQNELSLESEAAGNQLAGFFDQYIKTVEQMAVNPELKQVLSETGQGDNILEAEYMDTVRQNLMNVVETDLENFVVAWIADLDASVVTQSDNFTSDASWDITTRPWYSCIESKQVILTQPYLDSARGNLVLSAVAPVFDDSNNALGVAGVDIAMDHMIDTMSEYVIGDNGYILLLAGDGTVIYHYKEEYLQKNFSELNVSENLQKAVASGTEQFVRYKEDGISRCGVVSQVGDTGYTLISNMPLSEYYSLLIKMVIALIFVFIVGAILIVFSIRKSASNVTKPILELNHTAQLLAAGNLDVELDIQSEDEIGELGRSIGETVERLKEYIVYIDETAEVLGQISDGKLGIELKQDYVGEFQKLKMAMLNISSSMNHVMESISESSKQVSSGANDLANASQTLAENAGTQAAAVEELVATTVTVSEQVQNSRNDAENSSEATRKVASMILENQEKMKLMMDAVGKIHETSQQVVGIIQAIEDIASQTNLLSLNASIEAARAGEAGKGFAVVADEIGKLALESSKAANMTRNLIGVSMEEISKGNTIAENVMISLEESVNAVNNASDMIKKTAESAIVQAENVEQIRGAIEEINQSVQDNSAAAQEASATSQELASQATVLNELVERFELC